MQYSVKKLFITIAVCGALFAVIRSYSHLAWRSLPIGSLLLLVSAIAYPLAILGSPQIGTRLVPSANPFLKYIHSTAIVGASLIGLSILDVLFRPFYYFSP